MNMDLVYRTLKLVDGMAILDDEMVVEDRRGDELHDLGGGNKSDSPDGKRDAFEKVRWASDRAEAHVSRLAVLVCPNVRGDLREEASHGR